MTVVLVTRLTSGRGTEVLSRRPTRFETENARKLVKFVVPKRPVNTSPLRYASNTSA